MSKQTNNTPLEIGKQRTKKFIPLSTEFIRKHNILTEAKIQVIEDDSDEVIMIGAKNTGKTIVAMIATLIDMENHPKMHAMGFRKHKDMASTKMGSYFMRAVSLVRHYGYTPAKPWEIRSNRVYKMKLSAPSKVKLNQYMEFASLEDPSATDGSAPASLGYFGAKIVDEPIVKEDMLDASKIPTKEEWDDSQEHIQDNLERYNQAFATMYNVPLPKTKTWYLMNDYGKHPLSMFVHKHASQSKFVEKITGYPLEVLIKNKELIDNLCKFDEEKGETILDSPWAKMWMKTPITLTKVTSMSKKTLIVRMNKFANPDECISEKAIKNIKMIRRGFERANWRILARYAGLQFQAEIASEMLAFNIRNFNRTTPEKLYKEGYKIEAISYPTDIDTSRVFTITPILKMARYNRTLFGKLKKDEILHIDKMIELPAMGSGDFGEAHELSARMIANMIKKDLRKKFVSFSDLNKTLQTTHLIVDDNRKHYVGLLKPKLEGYIEHFTIPIKQGHYDIINRQDLIETGFKNGSITNHEQNKKYEDDIRSCVKADINSPKRKTSGSTNYLDRIDPVEYGIYPFQGVIHRKARKAGK